MSADGELAGQIETFLKSANERQELGKLGRSHCTENFSRNKVLEDILNYYRFVLEKSHE